MEPTPSFQAAFPGGKSQGYPPHVSNPETGCRLCLLGKDYFLEKWNSPKLKNVTD